MDLQLVVTAVGNDRRGLVGDFTGLVHAAGGNLADSRMLNLRGHFALVALIEGSGQVLGAIRAALEESAPKLGLSFTFASGTRVAGPDAGLPFRLKAYSMDQPGIVSRVTGLLRERSINIEDLTTRLEQAPFSGTQVFTLEAKVTVPPELQVRKLRADIDALAEALNCDIDLVAL